MILYKLLIMLRLHHYLPVNSLSSLLPLLMSILLGVAVASVNENKSQEPVCKHDHLLCTKCVNLAYKHICELFRLSPTYEKTRVHY